MTEDRDTYARLRYVCPIPSVEFGRHMERADFHIEMQGRWLNLGAVAGVSGIAAAVVGLLPAALTSALLLGAANLRSGWHHRRAQLSLAKLKALRPTVLAAIKQGAA